MGQNVEKWMEWEPDPRKAYADALKQAQLEKKHPDYMKQLRAQWRAMEAADIAAKPKPLERAFVAGPILGWRLWRTTPDGTLMSVYKNVLWPAGIPLRAVPKNPDEGVYALKDPTKLDGLVYTLTADQSGMVVGQVALWGTVIEHEHGYRAQYAYPALINLAPPMPGFPRPASLRRLAAAIRDRYGCEVTV
jgi:hypothetical protein